MFVLPFQTPLAASIPYFFGRKSHISFHSIGRKSHFYGWNSRFRHVSPRRLTSQQPSLILELQAAGDGMLSSLRLAGRLSGGKVLCVQEERRVGPGARKAGRIGFWLKLIFDVFFWLLKLKTLLDWIYEFAVARGSQHLEDIFGAPRFWMLLFWTSLSLFLSLVVG